MSAPDNFEIVFTDRVTHEVKYAINKVSRIRYITPSEVGYDKEGRSGSSSFPHTENVEIVRVGR